MSFLPADLPAWLRFWCDGLLRASVEGAAAIGLAWGIGALFPRIPATARCWLWRLAYLKLLISLLVAVPIHLPVLPAGAVPRTSYYATPPAAPLEGAAQTAPVDRSAAPSPAAEGWANTTGGGVALGIFGLWMAGVLWSALRVGREWLEARRLHAESRAVEDPWIVERCAELAFLFNLRRAPRILVAEGRGSPLLIGTGGPAVLLPASLLRDYSAEEVELMLAHELAHLKRGDLLWSWLPAVAHWLFFFHPLVWLANREWRLAQEMACDELAMEVTSAPAGEYGQVLVRVAAQSRLNLQAGLATVGLEETPDTLKRRLGAMKHPQRFSPARVSAFSVPALLVGGLALLPWKLAPAHAGGIPLREPLCYGWQNGRTYTYQVTVEAEHEGYREQHVGSLSYAAIQRGETVALSHSGSLFAQQLPTAGGGFPMRLRPASPFAPGFGGFGSGGGGQIRVDALGRILEQREGTALPYSLGSISRVVVEPLPGTETGAWEVSGDREILIEEPGQADRPPFGRMFREPAPVRLAGREWSRYAVRKISPLEVTVRKEYELRTVEEHAGSPRLRLAGEGLLAWDRRQGVPRALEFRGTLTESSPHLTRRTPVTLRYELQEPPGGTISAAPRGAPVSPSADDVQGLLDDLRSPDATRRQSAAGRMAALPPSDKRPGERRQEAAAALRPLLKDEQQLVRLLAVRALKGWGSAADVPSLIPLLRDKEAGVRWAAIEALAALKDPRGLAAVAGLVAGDRDRFFASRALREAGPAAEKPVLALLSGEDEAARTEACRLLEEVGSTASMGPLQKAATEGSPALRAAAEQAENAIRLRARTSTERGRPARPRP